MAKRGMPQVVAQGDRLGEWFVEAECGGDGAGNLRDLEHMSEPGPVMIAGRGQKNLGFVLEPPKRFGVDDAVAVPLIGQPNVAHVLLLRDSASPGGGAAGGK